MGAAERANQAEYAGMERFLTAALDFVSQIAIVAGAEGEQSLGIDVEHLCLTIGLRSGKEGTVYGRIMEEPDADGEIIDAETTDEERVRQVELMLNATLTAARRYGLPLKVLPPEQIEEIEGRLQKLSDERRRSSPHSQRRKVRAR